MATNIYDCCTNPVTGETFKGISKTPYAFAVQWTSKPGKNAIVEHIHHNQDEIMYVKKGELKVIVEGEEIIAHAGEKVIIQRGKRHMAFNNNQQESEVVIEFRPPLDYEKFLQCFTGMMNDGYLDETGAVNIPMMGYFLKRMKCKALVSPAGVAPGKLKMALNMFYWKGKIKGWNKLYLKYTR